MSRLVLITGSSRGIGADLALAFAQAKWNVAVVYHEQKKKAESICNQIKALGVRSEIFSADISDSTSVKNLLDAVQTQLGSVDCVVHSAAITRDRTILKMSDAEWNAVIDTNLSGSFWVLRESARCMRLKKSGQIILISSILGAKGSFGNANYVSAKAGVIGLTKAAARELGRFNIQVNAILPGFHLTDMGSTVSSEQQEKVKAEHTLSRFTDRRELSQFVVHLADLNSVSGQIFNIDSRIL